MEGRAIARPNIGIPALMRLPPNTFNGGPGNCPAKPDGLRWATHRVPVPSMEGRAIARPNMTAAPS